MHQHKLALGAAQRLQCQRCLRPQSTCICHWAVRMASEVEVVILQHPLEVKQAKGSARLLHLSLHGSELHTGELFDADVLKKLLHAPGKYSVLLYPEFDEALSHSMISPEQLDAEMLAFPASLRLIVLDGTWRKSRKMLYVNPLLQALPRLSLRNMPESHYRIRKAHRVDQLSTLEACCYALMQLEQDDEKFAPLLAAFDGFIEQKMTLSHRHYPQSADADA